MIYVIYGSETGNSEAIAGEISLELKDKMKLKHELMTMNHFNETVLNKLIENKQENFIILMVCSTTGNGDFPINSEKFIRNIKKTTHDKDLFNNFYYSVLGLGDSNYAKYQFIPKLIDQCFTSLGAKKILKRGEADDAYGLEDVVEPWKKSIYPKIKQTLVEIEKLNKESKEVLEIKSDKVEIVDDGNYNRKVITDSIKTNKPSIIEINDNGNVNDNDKTNNSFNQKIDISDNDNTNRKLTKPYHNLHNAKIINKEVLSGSNALRDIYKITLLLSEKISLLENYKCGSSIKILPKNKQNNIESLLKIITILDKDVCKHDLENLFDKRPYFSRFLNKSNDVSNVCIENILNYVIDLNYIPKRDYLKQFAAFIKTKNIDMGNRIEVMSNNISEIQENKITFIEILSESCNFNGFNDKIQFKISEILEYFPIMLPRSYSLITASNQDNIYNIEIIFSVVSERHRRNFKNKELKTIFNAHESKFFTYEGNCTSFLVDTKIDNNNNNDNIKNDDNVIVCSIEENLTFPELGNNNNVNTNVTTNSAIAPFIYISNGTGLSPFISYLQYVKKIVDKNNNQVIILNIPNVLVLTGFRSDSIDKNETIMEEYITRTIKLINDKIGYKKMKYCRCVSQDESIYLYYIYIIKLIYIINLIYNR